MVTGKSWNSPDISVIIPVFNSPEPLQRCLNALSSQQTAHAYEVIVVDDASAENPELLVKAFSDRLQTSFIRLDVNGGPGAARNAGVAVARGQIILFTDADCVPAPDWVEKMAQPFANCEVVGVKGVYSCQQTDLWARLAQLEFEERYELLASHDEIDFIDTCCGGYRREAFLNAGGFNAALRMNEDVDLAFRVKKNGGHFVFVPDAIVGHSHREGWYAYARLKFGRGFWRMKIYRFHPEKAGNDTYTPFSMKVQLLLVLILPFVIPFKTARFVWKAGWFFACVPLMRLALPERIGPALWAPIFCLVRAVSLLAGMASAVLSELQNDRK